MTVAVEFRSGVRREYADVLGFSASEFVDPLSDPLLWILRPVEASREVYWIRDAFELHVVPQANVARVTVGDAAAEEGERHGPGRRGTGARAAGDVGA